MSYQVTKPGCLFIWCYNIGFITYLFYQLLVHVWFRCVRFSFISTALSDCLRKHHRKDQLLCTVGWLVDWLIKLRFYVPLDTECVILEMLFPARLFWLMDIRPQSVFLSFFRYILDLNSTPFFLTTRGHVKRSVCFVRVSLSLTTYIPMPAVPYGRYYKNFFVLITLFLPRYERKRLSEDNRLFNYKFNTNILQYKQC